MDFTSFAGPDSRAELLDSTSMYDLISTSDGMNPSNDEWIPLEVDDSEVRERNLIASLGYAQRYGAVSAPGATLSHDPSMYNDLTFQSIPSHSSLPVPQFRRPTMHLNLPAHPQCFASSNSNTLQPSRHTQFLAPNAAPFGFAQQYARSSYQSGSNTINTAPICTVYNAVEPDTYVFRCQHAKCQDKTFARWYDFKRHYNGAHATTPIVYWCKAEGCVRSKAVGERPFPRKDKLDNHIEKMHGSEGL